jgi:hypothetical protein
MRIWMSDGEGVNLKTSPILLPVAKAHDTVEADEIRDDHKVTHSHKACSVVR